MLEQAETTLEELDAEAVNGGGAETDPEEIESKRVRVRNLQESIKLQLTRLERQIEYIKVHLEMRRVKKQLAEIDEDDEDEASEQQAEKLRRRLAERTKKYENLVAFMKDANRRALQQQQQQQQSNTNNEEGKNPRLII